MHTQFEIVKKIKESGNDVVVQIKKPEKTLWKNYNKFKYFWANR
jgi:hypothetical protein